MDELDFEILSHEQGPPFRTRSVFVDYSVFATGGRSVLVGLPVQAILRERARGAFPRETGGVLLGRILQDGHGPYTLVEGAVAAPPDVGGHGELQLSAELTSRLKDDGARQFPSCDPVGWWHSHPYPSSYSNTDCRNQSLWTDPGHVGILVFAKADDDWGDVYIGPESQLAQRSFRDAEQCRRAGQTEPEIPPQKGLNQRPARRWPQQLRNSFARRGQPTVGRTITTLALLLATFVTAVLCAYYNLARLIEERMPQDSRPRLTWGCPLSDDLTEYRCAARTDSPDELMWRINGNPVLGASVTVPRPGPGESTSVELWLVGQERRYMVESFSLDGTAWVGITPASGPTPEGLPSKTSGR